MNREELEEFYSYKALFNNMTYEQMLRLNRFGDDSIMFSGEIGDHFMKVLAKKRDELTHDEQVAASKRIGWT